MLTDAFPSRREDRSALADTRRAEADLLALRGEMQAAEAGYRLAERQYEHLLERSAVRPDDRQGLATVRSHLGELQLTLGRPDLAAASHRAALELLQGLAADFPKQPRYRREMARAHHGIAKVHHQRGELPAAEEACRREVAIDRVLVDEIPGDHAHRVDLSTSVMSLGVVFKMQVKLDQAEAAYDESVELQERLVAEFPNVPRYRHMLSTSLGNLSLLLTVRDDLAGARRAGRRAASLRQELSGNHPDVPEYRHDLAGSTRNLGLLAFKDGDWLAAEQAGRDALTHWQDLAAAHPDVPLYRTYVGIGCADVARALQARGLPRQATGLCERSVRTLTEVVRRVPRQAVARRELAEALTLRARLLRDSDRPLAAAFELVRAAEREPQVAGDRLVAAADAFLESGFPSWALVHLERAAAGDDADVRFASACRLARCASLNDVCRPDLARRAMAILQKLQGEGYFADASHRARMGNDAALGNLGRRPDFPAVFCSAADPPAASDP